VPGGVLYGRTIVGGAWDGSTDSGVPAIGVADVEGATGSVDVTGGVGAGAGVLHR